MESKAGRAIWLRSAEHFVNRADVVQTVVAIAPEDEEFFEGMAQLGGILVAEHFQFLQTGQRQLVVNHPVLYPLGGGVARDVEGVAQGCRHRLFAVDVLAGVDSPSQ